MSGKEVTYTAMNFDSQVQKGVSLVDFWAPWCGPCKMQGPILEQVADKLGDKANIGKCNVDEEPDLAGRFGIQSIPTLLFMKDGEEVDRVMGLQSEEALTARLGQYL